MITLTKVKIEAIAVGLALMGLVGYVGANDYDDAVAQQRAYCVSVDEGLHPDYNGNYDKICVDN